VSLFPPYRLFGQSMLNFRTGRKDKAIILLRPQVDPFQLRTRLKYTGGHQPMQQAERVGRTFGLLVLRSGDSESAPGRTRLFSHGPSGLVY
jgi:hypothetical protein